MGQKKIKCGTHILDTQEDGKEKKKLKTQQHMYYGVHSTHSDCELTDIDHQLLSYYKTPPEANEGPL
ncbi:hypothetical protein GYMLUDRAFT_389476 [Collybiopsis luxurians FD-317 M1]|nr:hypothetical protein GYMLUDRAFT_389476 [Collybiopsis luxurians FD-317 M1]